LSDDDNTGRILIKSAVIATITALP